MSDNIPFEIQLEIIKKIYDIKPLIQFRSVSKSWKSFIDSSEFIKGYGGTRRTHPHSYILNMKFDSLSYLDFICLVDDDKETFKILQQQVAPFVMSPLLKQFRVYKVLGVSHGLLCFYGIHNLYNNLMLVIWNPSIGKSFRIVIPNYDSRIVYGFGVCPVTCDPTVVKLLCSGKTPWQVEVFTLSSGVWNVIPIGDLPRQSIQLNSYTQVVIDTFIYWGALEATFRDDRECTINHMVVSFDLITKEFKTVDLPNTNEMFCPVSVSKLRGSLVVYATNYLNRAECCVWVMEHDLSFRKLFTIATRVSEILGFSKSGETIFEIRKDRERLATLNVYDPCSQQIKNLGISGGECSFFMGYYKESLLLLDHPDLHIYSGDS